MLFMPFMLYQLYLLLCEHMWNEKLTRMSVFQLLTDEFCNPEIFWPELKTCELSALRSYKKSVGKRGCV